MKQFRTSMAIALLCSMAFAAWGQQTEDARKISTSGDSAVFVVPDEAVLSFGTTSFAKELAEAKANNDEATAKLTSAVKTLGIEPRYLAMDNMEVAIKYNHNKFSGGQGTEPVGFEVSRLYMVTLKDVTKLQAAIDTVLTNGANTFNGVTLKSSELRKHRDDARAMAVKAAKEKAVALAAALDCTVGPPQAINETVDRWGAYSSGRSGSELLVLNSRQDVPTSVDLGAGDMPLGQIAIQAGVSVTFDLVPAAAAK